MSTLAEQKKLILPYLQRADEIQALSPKVAYYLRLYAIEQGLQIPSRAPEIQGVLEALMEKLEQDKPGLALGDEDAQVCEAFAVTVFNRADKVDRAGKADANTVKAFYVATIFIDMLNHFGELPPDMAERQRYAAWKAADIRKALREGRVPDPGPPVKEADLDLDLPDIPGSSASALPPPPPPGPSPPLSQDPAGMRGPSNDSDLPSIPGPGGASAAAPGPGPPAAHKNAELGPPRFRPGSKVFYNGPGERPEPGTVVTVSRTPSSWVCRVGLRQQVTDARESQLAHDFAPGAAVSYTPRGGTAVPATVSKVDAASWPIAYLLTLASGETVPTTEASLSPAVPEQPAEPAGPASPAASAPSSSLPPPPPASAADGYESDADESEAAAPQPPPLDSLSLSGPDADQIPPPEASGSGFPAASQPQPSASSGYPAVYHSSNAPPRSSPKAGAHPSSSQAGSGLSDFTAASATPGPPAAAAPPSPSSSAARQPVGPPQPSPAAPAAAATAAAVSLPAGVPGYQPSLAQMTEAHKLTKYALSSLSFEDVPTAIQNLRRALELLQGTSGR